jgi:hypothetical protein
MTSWNPVIDAKDELPRRKPQDIQAHVINTDVDFMIRNAKLTQFNNVRLEGTYFIVRR